MTQLRLDDVGAERPIAALFVDPNGPYAGREGVDVWGEERDARAYIGNKPGVWHPPCQRWGKYWGGGPNPAARRRRKGDDGGCFKSSLADCRRVGGVIEHPEASYVWPLFRFPKPPKSGGWIPSGDGGWLCYIEQGNYGHPARKPTILLAYGYPDGPPPPMIWGPAPTSRRLEDGFHTSEERRAARAAGVKPRKRLTAAQRIHTPHALVEELIAIARGVRG